jgi:hypothetical protein
LLYTATSSIEPWSGLGLVELPTSTPIYVLPPHAGVADVAVAPPEASSTPFT